jgi:predicted HicB family RNase H-like nuclease
MKNDKYSARLTIDMNASEHTFLKLASARKRLSMRQLVVDYINEIIKSVDNDNLEDDMNKLIRLSVDVNHKYHKKIKMHAAKQKISIREFVINCIDFKLYQMEISDSILSETRV